VLGVNEVVIQAMTPEHWPDVREIYRQGIATRNATFDTEAPPWEWWDAHHLGHPRLIAVAGGRVVGWAALVPVSPREVYRGVAELSIYVAEGMRGLGVGRALLSGLIAQSEGAGIWTLQAGMFPENEASLRLHRACGFRVVGTHERIGRLDGRWRDVLLLERRSPVVG
jgi:L-amino acid N-acyltransferase YncA